MARGVYFNDKVHPGLLRALEESGRGYKKHRVELFSGRADRPKNPSSYHPKGGAIDVNLYDPDTGALLENFQDPSSAQAYQSYANEVYKWAQQNDPELAKQLRWGGYFGGGEWKRDWMHFDVGGAENTQGGNWEQGFDQPYMQQAGLKSSGGLGAVAQQMAEQGYTREQILDALAAIESRGSGDYAAVGKETDPAGHRARGRYQVMDYNIGPWAEQYLGRKGVTTEQFMADPKLQDELAGTVMEDYIKQHGVRGAYSKWFTGRPDEPNVTDVNGKLTGKSYADLAQEHLGRMNPNAASVGAYSDSPSEGGGRFGGGGLGTPEKAPDVVADKKKSWWDKTRKALSENLGDMGGSKISTPQSGIGDQPRAVLAPVNPTTIGVEDAQATEYRRANLANIMAKLNSQKLW